MGQQQDELRLIPPVTIVAHDIGPVGGMELQLSELIRGLLARGAEVTVISRTCALEPHARLRWIRVPGPARPFALAFPWFFAVGSLLTRRHRRGVLHTTGAIVANRADVCTVHFCHRASRDLSRASTRGLLHRLNARIASPLKEAGERFAYRTRRGRSFVAVSRGLAGELRSSYPGISSQVVEIPNGVDTQRFHPDDARRREVRHELGVADGELLALFVGGEWERKGLEVALRAIAQVDGVTLAIVGDGDVERYDALACELGIARRVQFLGRLPQPERYHAAADVFVLPSAYETFSLVAHEAAASGVPLLATRVHGIDDLLVDGENGWFIDLDPATVAARLAALRDDPQRRHDFGVAARGASERYSWERMTGAYVDVYCEVNA